MIDEAKVKQVLRKVAEEFAFMFADEYKETGDLVCDRLIKSKMAFSGPLKGEIIMIAPEELCRNMVSNVLGIDESEGGGANVEPEEALCEFLNIFCGNLLTEIGGEENVFDLYPPEAEDIKVGNLEDIVSGGGFISLLLDDIPLFVKVDIE